MNLNTLQQLICENQALEAELKNIQDQESFLQHLAQFAQKSGLPGVMTQLKETIAANPTSAMQDGSKTRSSRLS